MTEAPEVERIELESLSVMVGWGLFTKSPALGGDGGITLLGWMRYRNHVEVFQKAIYGSTDSWIRPVVVVNDELLYDTDADDLVAIQKLRKVAAVPPWVKWKYWTDLAVEL